MIDVITPARAAARIDELTNLVHLTRQEWSELGFLTDYYEKTNNSAP